MIPSTDHVPINFLDLMEYKFYCCRHTLISLVR